MAHKKIQDPRDRARLRRKYSIRKRISGTADKPRLSVFRSNSHIYIQAIDDVSGRVLAASSDREPSLQGELAGKKKSEKAKVVGMALAKKLTGTGVQAAVFDRNGFIFHGRVKQVAEGAREGGLKF